MQLILGPLVYLVLCLAQLQGAAFAVEGASRTAALVAGALALAFSLTGCLAGTPVVTSTPEATPAPTAEPTPTALATITKMAATT